MTNRLYLLIEALDRATETALASAEALGPRAYVHPVPGQWAAAQVIHHLLTAEKSIAAGLRRALATDHAKWQLATLKHKVRGLLLRLALRVPGLKFKVPATLPPPPDPSTIAPLPELRAEWEAVRRQLEQVLHEFPGTKLNHTVFRHPRAGWLTVSQTVTSILDHTLHHQQQLDRISKALKQVRQPSTASA
ncbi:DinB family protein [Siccationidurans ginsengisoli]|nr:MULTISPECIES: DinB family protein [unclassified Hymenobacter]MBO2033342.1 DinB family protein [Hymenobacter sp. BT559]